MRQVDCQPPNSHDRTKPRANMARRETYQFIPHTPVTTFMGKTIVPSTVNLPKMSDVFSCRSFMRMLICAR